MVTSTKNIIITTTMIITSALMLAAIANIVDASAQSSILTPDQQSRQLPEDVNGNLMFYCPDHTKTFSVDPNAKYNTTSFAEYEGVSCGDQKMINKVNEPIKAGADALGQKLAFALSQGEGEFNNAIKEEEKLVGFEMSEGMVNALHKAAEKYNRSLA
jgi:hypothetical protein